MSPFTLKKRTQIKNQQRERNLGCYELYIKNRIYRICILKINVLLSSKAGMVTGT